MVGYTIFICAMAIAIACISYAPMAEQAGWPIGEILHRGGSIPNIIAFLTIPWIIVKSFILYHWWSPLVIVAIGWLLALVLTMTLKKNVQFLCVFGIWIAFLLTVSYFPGAKPSAILHHIFG